MRKLAVTVAEKEIEDATFFDFFDTRKLPESIDTQQEQRMEREICGVLNIAEEFMYELIPKALYYYLNLETTDEAPKNQEPNGEKEKEEKNGEEGEDKESEKKDEKSDKPTCILQ
eukprot:TRINITY_DN11988_c0_g1_i1.p1 TRINITY_DN11988_c0_g1~~TRINITY_DN11988_c0_g1_i1.p1  ORF type:complete len:115 (+),score=38.41 TRINITY_DN11988_c0_g1_i1:260-604(+)